MVRKLIAHVGLAFQHILFHCRKWNDSAHVIEALGGGQGKAQREGHMLSGSTGPESSCPGRFPPHVS